MKARHAALFSLLPLCTTAKGFSHYTAFKVFLGCIFCFIHELSAQSIYLSRVPKVCYIKKPTIIYLCDSRKIGISKRLSKLMNL